MRIKKYISWGSFVDPVAIKLSELTQYEKCIAESKEANEILVVKGFRL